MGGQTYKIKPHKGSENYDRWSEDIQGVFALDHYWLVTIGTEITLNVPRGLPEKKPASAGANGKTRTCTYRTSTPDLLCFVLHDLGTTQIMTTVPSASDLEPSEFIPKEKIRGIPNDSMLKFTNGSITLPIPLPIREYNKHIGGSDANSQGRSYYSADMRSFRYWWLLFKLLLDGGWLNVFNPWKILNPQSKLSHVNFQHEIAMKLVKNPLVFGEKYAPQIQMIGNNPSVPPLHHNFVHPDKKTSCQVLRLKRNTRKRGRDPLASIDGNENWKIKGTSQTS